MKLTIRNIGKLKEANININGITVIAGENNTGKSTVGKSLWALFNGLYKINEQVLIEKLKNIEYVLIKFYRIVPNDSIIFKDFEDKIKIFKRKISNNKNLLNFNENELKEEIINLFNDGIKMDDINEVTNEILKIIELEEKKIIQRIIQNRLKKEFNEQVNNLYSYSSEGELILEIKNKKFEIKILDEKVEEINIDGFLNTEALYIDSPDILDTAGRQYLFRSNPVGHKEQLQDKLLNTEENIIEEITVEEKLEKIYSELNTIISGKFVNRKIKGLSYTEGDNIELNIKNLSMGMKTFAILKILLDNGALKENGTIILDEPEIHLHPEWQIVLAELIVLLQKEFGMHILLTTHSPYFLKAIQVYSKKYDITEKCNYYMTEIEGKEAILIEKTNNIQDIFYKLTIPFENLMNEEEIYE